MYVNNNMEIVVGVAFLFIALIIVFAMYIDDESLKGLWILCLACFILAASGGFNLGYKCHEYQTVQQTLAIDSVVAYKETN